jgi:hypothetical protein
MSNLETKKKTYSFCELWDLIMELELDRVVTRVYWCHESSGDSESKREYFTVSLRRQ